MTAINFFQKPLSSPFSINASSENSHKSIVTNYMKNSIGKMTVHTEKIGKLLKNIYHITIYNFFFNYFFIYLVDLVDSAQKRHQQNT